MNFVVENPPAKATGRGLITSEPSPEFLELEAFVNANPGQWVKLGRPMHSTNSPQLRNRLTKRNPSETMKYESTCRKAVDAHKNLDGSDTDRQAPLYWIYVRRVTI